MNIHNLEQFIDNSIKQAVSKTAFYFESELSRLFQTEGRSLNVNWPDYKSQEYFQDKVNQGFSEKKLHKTTSLVQSFSHILDGYKANIGTPVKYAKYHELGTRKMSQRPFFQPVLQHIINENIFSRFLRESLNGR